VEIMPDEGSVQYTANGALDVEQAQDWLERAARVLITQPGGILSLGAEIPETNRVIGLVSIFFLDEARKQIGFTIIIAPGNRKQGFGAEAVGGVLKFAFEGLNLHRVTAECDSRNAAARRLLEKAGLRREGESVQSRFQKGEWINEIWYAALLTDALQASNRS
jgi:aminoglycoside 6'-N-acetyltransferase